MKILVLHNTYQNPGGEDSVVSKEIQLLQAYGHHVISYRRHNDELRAKGKLAAISAGVESVWAARTVREVGDLVAREKPDVAHFHNTFPLISPSAYYACARAGVPIVQTLHNYRLLCPSAELRRGNSVCEECLGWHLPLPGIAYGCYRQSRSATAVVAAVLAFHRAMGTWQGKVDSYIALSDFSRHKLVQGGLPADRIVVKPHFVSPDPGASRQPRKYALYVGRLSEEKGLNVLLAAWVRLRNPIPLRIVGDGPLRSALAIQVRKNGIRGIELTGWVAPEEVFNMMHGARFLLFPSVCFETFGLTIAEAFACGVPAIASRLGAIGEIVEDGKTGLHFSPGDAADLAAKAEWAWTHPQEVEVLGQAARAEFERKYTASQNYTNLIRIYERLVPGIGRHDGASA